MKNLQIQDLKAKNLCLYKTAVDDIKTSCTGLMPVALCSLFNETFDAVQVASWFHPKQ